MKRQKGAGKVLLDRPRTARPGRSRCRSAAENGDRSSTPNFTVETCRDMPVPEERHRCADAPGSTNFMRRIHKGRAARGKLQKRGRGSAQRKDGSQPSADARKSQFQYLRNINVHDRRLRMAVVQQALFAHGAGGEEHSAELKRFERFDLFTLVFALIYLRRIVGLQRPALDVSLPLFLVCNIIALKYQDDFSTSNCRYLRVFGLTLRDLNRLEADVLRRLNYCAGIEYSEIISVIDESIGYLGLLGRGRG